MKQTSWALHLRFIYPIAFLISALAHPSITFGDSPQMIILSSRNVAPVTLTPTHLQFGPQVEGTTSAPQTVTFENNQSIPVTLTAITSSTAEFIATPSCSLSPNTLGALSTCTVSVVFSPQGTGTRKGDLVFTDSASNSPQTVTLGGTGKAPTLASITVSPQPASVALGTTLQFSATGTYTNGATETITNSVVWTSSAPAIATISSSGLATSVSQGTTQIVATSGTISGSVNLTVGPATLASLAIAPPAITIPVNGTQQLRAIATYADGSTMDLTNSATWSSANSGIAGISPQGIVIGGAVGAVNVTATVGSIAASSGVNVSSASLVSISVTPAVPTVPVGIPLLFTATGTFSDGSTANVTDTVTWSSDTPIVATVSNTAGTQGLATGVSGGGASITATSGTITSSTTLTVTSATLVSITVSSANSSTIAPGTTLQLTATGTFSDSNTCDLTAIAGWSSDTSSVGTVNSTGLVSGISSGAANVSATWDGVTGSMPVMVSNASATSISISPLSSLTPAGTTQQFAATGIFSDGSTQDLTLAGHWTSTNALVGTISDSTATQGLAISLSAGSTTIGFAFRSLLTSASLNVSPATLASISISPQSALIGLPGTQQFAATGHYTDGSSRDITALVQWASSSATVAVVGNAAAGAGLSTGAGLGAANISASLGSISASATLNIVSALPVSIAVTPSSFSFVVGQSQQLTAIGTYTDGSTQDVSQLVGWASSAQNVAAVVTNASASAIAVGSATLTATAGSVSGSSTATVTIPLQHIVFMVKENRSFDNYFGAFPGANGASTCVVSNGQTIPISHAPDRVRNMGHAWSDSMTAIDGGKMDQFDLVFMGNFDGDYETCSQYYQSDMPNYWTYAQQYVLADNMFSSLSGPSFPNHLYTVAAWGEGVITNPVPPNGPGFNWGCDAVAGTLVQVLQPNGTQTKVFPCFTFTSLADALETSGTSWRYYAPQIGNAGYIWNTLDAFSSIRETSLWSTNDVTESQFATDALAGNLPAVSWLIGDNAESEHPAASVCKGENWTIEQINAIMQGPDWDSTAIFITWDDFGGFYDHVPPPAVDTWGFGIRVPLLIVSPYAKAGYISHTRYDFASVLKTMEETFGLSPLSTRDANDNDTFDSFDFTQSPRSPLVLKTRTCPPLGPYAGVGGNLTFPTQSVGTTTTLDVTVTSSGTAPLVISDVISPSSPFSQTNDCVGATLAVGNSCTINVGYAPTKAGRNQSYLLIVDNDTAQPQEVQIYGAAAKSASDNVNDLPVIPSSNPVREDSDDDPE